jgi:hypothetical protein
MTDMIVNPINVNAVNAVTNAKVANVLANAPANTDLLATTLSNLGESLGEWKAYDSQLPITEIKGTRIFKSLYQTNTKTGLKAGENSYVRIPVNHITVDSVAANIDELAPYIVSYLQSIEDLEFKKQHKSGRLNIFTNGLTMEAVIDLLEASSENSGRLNKEMIEAWFEMYIADALTELFAAKMGIDEMSLETDLLRLQKTITAYKAKFASLSNPKVSLVEADCKAMINVIEKSLGDNEIDSMSKRFIAKLDKLMNKEDDILEGL